MSKQNSFSESGTSPTVPVIPLESLAFDLREASVQSGTTIWFLRSSIWSGKLKARLAGKRLLIRREDLVEFLDDLPAVRSGKIVNRKKRKAS